MTNHVGNIFGFANERSWQVRFDYDFAASGIPGLLFSTKYIKGWGVERADKSSGHEWERDFSIRYVVQSGAARDLNISIGLSTLRSTIQKSYDETKLTIGYPLKLL